MAYHFTDAEVDELLMEVEQAVNTSAKLAKNFGQKPTETDDAPPMGDDAGAPPPGAGAPPAPGAGAPPPGAAPGGDGDADDQGGDPTAGLDADGTGADGGAGDGTDDTAPGGGGDGDADDGSGAPGTEGAADGQGDQALEGDQGGQGGEELSDQELHQIYSGMDPADQERHYMVLRAVLRQSYQKFEKSEPNSNEDEEMSKEQVKKFEDEIAALKKSNKEMEESLGGALKAVEIMAKPTRKAVVGTVEMIAKSETVAQNDLSGLSKSEIVTKIGEKVRDPSLSKNDRTTMNRYVLSKTEEGRQEVLSILGGKK